MSKRRVNPLALLVEVTRFGFARGFSPSENPRARRSLANSATSTVRSFESERALNAWRAKVRKAKQEE